MSFGQPVQYCLVVSGSIALVARSGSPASLASAHGAAARNSHAKHAASVHFVLSHRPRIKTTAEKRSAERTGLEREIGNDAQAEQENEDGDGERV